MGPGGERRHCRGGAFRARSSFRLPGGLGGERPRGLRHGEGLLPLLRASRGRVVLMGSVSGLVALPLMGPYAASKFALEALADALRVELLPFGVRVVLIEPGSVATPIWERSLRRAEGYLEPPPPGTEGVYGRYLEVARRVAERSAKRGLPPRGWRRPCSRPWKAQTPGPATWWPTRPGPGKPSSSGSFLPPYGTGSWPGSSANTPPRLWPRRGPQKG